MGYFVEVLGAPLTCFDASQYGMNIYCYFLGHAHQKNVRTATRTHTHTLSLVQQASFDIGNAELALQCTHTKSKMKNLRASD